MGRPQKWSIDKKEKLFEIACGYEKAFRRSDLEITQDSDVILAIHVDFAESDCTPLAILYQLKEMKILGVKSRKDGIFIRPSTPLVVDNFKIGPAYPPLAPLELEQIRIAITEHLQHGHRDALHLCLSLSGQFQRSSRNIRKILSEANVLRLAADGKWRLDEKFTRGLPNPLHEWLAGRQAPPSVHQQIIAQRALAGQFYSAANHSLPAVIRSTDGTGYGKTYAVFDQYLKGAGQLENGVRHRNLLFITPQKAQIDIDQHFVEEAKRLQVPFLPILSREDLADPEYADWVTKEKNRSRYARWCTEGKKAADLRPVAIRLETILHQIDQTRSLLNVAADGAEHDLQRKHLVTLNGRLRTLLKELGLAAVNGNGKPLSVSDIASRSSKYDALRLEIIGRCFPLELALHQPCILLATTMKFDTEMATFVQGPSGHYNGGTADFYELIGGSRADKDVLVSAAALLPDDDQRAFIKDKLFAVDEKNRFRQRRVAFKVVIDEEHESYRILAAERKVSLIAPETNVPHVLSSAWRLYRSIGGDAAALSSDSPLHGIIRDFFARAEDLLRDHCEISPGQSLAKILSLFESNIGNVQIDKGDVEQVINITRNVFSFTPKRFFNEQALRSIRLRGKASNSYCQIYFGTQDDGNPTLHDLFQLLMALLTAASEVKSKDLPRMLGYDSENSQNASLGQFIVKAIGHRQHVRHLFDRTMNEDQVINVFFTYFQPKTVFSIEPRRTVGFKDERLNDYVYADFRLDLLRELPEVSLMRMAYNTHNALFTLSATTGFYAVYNGNYNHKALRHYGEGGKHNLQFRVVCRAENDVPILEKLRAARGEVRRVAFHTFPAKGDSISATSTTERKREVNYWFDALQPEPHIRNNPYHKRELLRQIDAILLAAREGKSSLILSLSGNIRGLFKKFVDRSQGMSRKLKRCDKDVDHIYDFEPYSDGYKLRLVFFNSEVGKMPDLRAYTEMTSERQRLVFVAPYTSAGTGLNYFVTYEGTEFKEDFNRLVLVNSPYYSEVMQPEQGLNTLDNWITLMKSYADGKEVKYLRDFDTTLVSGANYSVLMREHAMSIFKVVMQAIGRVERVDSIMTSEIYLADEILENATMQFEHIGRHGNEVVLGSMSLLNLSFRNHCRSRAAQVSFDNAEARIAFETRMEASSRQINDLFSKVLRQELQRARKGERQAIALNEVLRSMDCVFAPEKWLAAIKRIPGIAENAYYTSVIDSFFVRRSGQVAGIRFCVKANSAILTDTFGGATLYDPQLQILPGFTRLQKSPGEFWRRYAALAKAQEDAFNDFVPVPAILPLLKGNVGEYLLDGLLEQLGLPALSPEEVFDKLFPACYELFDRYLEVDNALICIDAKNWSSTFDQAELAQKVHAEAACKMDLIRTRLTGRYEQIKFIYLNTRADKNPLNLMAESDGTGAHYLNLLKRETSYTPSREKQESNATDRLVLNARLLSMLMSGV